MHHQGGLCQGQAFPSPPGLLLGSCFCRTELTAVNWWVFLWLLGIIPMLSTSPSHPAALPHPQPLTLASLEGHGV